MDAKPVVVGVDGGPDSLKALAWAADYASTVGAPVIALAAVETPAVVGPYAMAGWVDPEVLEDRARTMLADSVRDTLGDEAQVEQTVIRGHPAEAIVTASQDARLVVVGSRGWGGFRGLLMGSVSQHVVSHAHSPVVVLPRQSEDA
ncbi:MULTISPECIES: universal stress protein [unclassified Dietzia]|uniref:universal stress protein n=1 Tax=unclassified Dietzia TaxID=2617939 RepID=UPI000D20D428|nr:MULTISPECIES: universal stress protein [unclassified Dietzia]AVZ39446.1 universal stress protein [Dietzia sp. JS16-p6b]MBB1023235.1 universal stress protein [Dietzia sp. DQ12-76]MBB1027783.1 universal stress protein [Dietzia sp. DQ11-38-2]QGW24722.1 UspA domain-containing protein [Dietzia sp. DQ12-45-1b]